MERNKPIKGQVLYAVPANNAARYNPYRICTTKVKSVGHKYFKCGSDQYTIEDWHIRSQYPPDYYLFPTEQGARDYIDRNRLTSHLRNAVGRYGSSQLDANTLRAMNAMLPPGQQLALTYTVAEE